VLVDELHKLVVEESMKLDSLEKNKLIQRTAALEAMIRQANAIHLQFLSWQWNVTLEEELLSCAELKQEHVDKMMGLSNTLTLEQLEEQIQQTQHSCWLRILLRGTCILYCGTKTAWKSACGITTIMEMFPNCSSSI
jgi:hypothetical protein